MLALLSSIPTASIKSFRESLKTYDLWKSLKLSMGESIAASRVSLRSLSCESLLGFVQTGHVSLSNPSCWLSIGLASSRMADFEAQCSFECLYQQSGDCTR